MRVLCTCVPARSRFHVMAPLAQALADAGHDVLFAVAASFLGEVRASGFEAVEAGSDTADLRAAARARAGHESIPPDRLAALMFTRLAPLALLADLTPLAEEWQPDLLLHEEGELGGALVAELLGVPDVVVGWPSPMRSPGQARRLEASLAATRTAAALRPAPPGGLHGHLLLDACPPSLQAAHAASVKRREPLRPVPWTEPEAAGWEPGDPSPGVPTVHVTLGMVGIYNRAPEVFRAIIDGLRGEPLRLVVTVGDETDPASFGPLGERLRIEPYVPHARLLPHCDAVVCHGGVGTTAAALAHGLPLLLSPRGGASQMRNAVACVRAGAALHLAPEEITPDAVRRSVRALLDEPCFRRRAAEIAAEIRALPAPASRVGVLEELVAGAGAG